MVSTICINRRKKNQENQPKSWFKNCDVNISIDKEKPASLFLYVAPFIEYSVNSQVLQWYKHVCLSWLQGIMEWFRKDKRILKCINKRGQVRKRLQVSYLQKFLEIINLKSQCCDFFLFSRKPSGLWEEFMYIV